MTHEPRRSTSLSLITAGLMVSAPVWAQSPDVDLAIVAAFFAGADVVEGPDLVDCTLSGGAKTTCFSLTVRPNPLTYTPGPWCPTQITDGADAGGIWFVDGKAVDVDGAFLASLADVYGDTNWQLFEPETGSIRFTGSLEACEAAARPDVDPAYQNHCVQCLPEYMPEDATITYVIPLQPTEAARPTPTNRTGAGIAFNGVRLDGPAPLEAILGAYTIAPFDDCGGHVNPHVGYHYHAVTECLSDGPAVSDPVETTHGDMIGIAMDGHAIFGHELAEGTARDDLDACNGHESEGLAYHYHAGAVGSNQILGCLAAQAGCVLREGETTCDASLRPPRP